MTYVYLEIVICSGMKLALSSLTLPRIYPMNDEGKRTHAKEGCRNLSNNNIRDPHDEYRGLGGNCNIIMESEYRRGSGWL